MSLLGMDFVTTMHESGISKQRGWTDLSEPPTRVGNLEAETGGVGTGCACGTMLEFGHIPELEASRNPNTSMSKFLSLLSSSTMRALSRVGPMFRPVTRKFVKLLLLPYNVDAMI